MCANRAVKSSMPKQTSMQNLSIRWRADVNRRGRAERERGRKRAMPLVYEKEVQIRGGFVPNDAVLTVALTFWALVLGH